MISTVERKKAQILDALSVEQIYGPRMELHPYAGKHRGLCPFHSEKTPSFVVYPDKHFHCFGCRKHGSAIDFVIAMYGLNFRGALAHLASQAGIPFNDTTNNSRAKWE